MSLLFAAGSRPSLRDVERVLAAERAKSGAAVVSHRPAAQEGWVELLASGLTFDLSGLAPGAPAPIIPARHAFGPDKDLDPSGFEALAILPGPHLAGAGAMIPLVRVFAGLAASLALGLRARAVCWHPVATWMEAGYFARIVRDWLAGGPFPALGLTAVEINAAGGISSVGLSYFTGQEMILEARKDETRVESVRLAVRLIDYLVQEGRLHERVEIAGPGGVPLIAEPSADGGQVMVWRG